MITDRRKLYLFIACKAFRTCDEEQLSNYIDTFVNNLSEEELQFCLNMFDKEK